MSLAVNFVYFNTIFNCMNGLKAITMITGVGNGINNSHHPLKLTAQCRTRRELGAMNFQSSWQTQRTPYNRHTEEHRRDPAQRSGNIQPFGAHGEVGCLDVSSKCLCIGSHPPCATLAGSRGQVCQRAGRVCIPFSLSLTWLCTPWVAMGPSSAHRPSALYLEGVSRAPGLQGDTLLRRRPRSGRREE